MIIKTKEKVLNLINFKLIQRVIAIVLFLTLSFSFTSVSGMENITGRDVLDRNPVIDENDTLDDTNINSYTDTIRDGTARRHTGDENPTEINAGSRAFSYMVMLIVKVVTFPLAGVQALITVMYNESLTPENREADRYKEYTTSLFTIEALVFNRVGLLESNFFRDSPEGLNNLIKENVRQWHVTMIGISLVISFVLLLYLAIRLMMSTVSEKPGKRANAKAMLTDIVVGMAIAMFSGIIVALISYFSDFLLSILINMKETFASNDVLSFEKMIIYGYLDFQGKLPATTYLINGIAFGLLVILQVKFLWVFVQRFLVIAFLTIIAPLISITYPVDKFKDGKSQVFTNWLHEISTTIFILPLYAAIYLMFLIAAAPIAEKAPIIGIIFLVYFDRIEAIVKTIFGFQDLKYIRSVGSIKFDNEAQKAVDKSRESRMKKKESKD